MATYVTLAQMKAALPVELTEELLDDSGSGVPDAANWPAIAARVSDEIDGKIGQRYTLPLSPVPVVLTNAAFVLAAELIYQRKNYHGEANPWFTRAQGIRGTLGQPGGQAGLLDRIASGEQPLTPEINRAKPAAVAITETSRLVPTRPTGEGRGHMMS